MWRPTEGRVGPSEGRHRRGGPRRCAPRRSSRGQGRPTTRPLLWGGSETRVGAPQGHPPSPPPKGVLTEPRFSGLRDQRPEVGAVMGVWGHAIASLFGSRTAPPHETQRPPPPPPRVTFRRVVVSLRGPGQSPVRPFACCVGSLRSVGRCGRCSCGCRFRVRGARGWVCWGCDGCGGVCRLCVSGAQWGLWWLWRGSFDWFCCPHTSVPPPHPDEDASERSWAQWWWSGRLPPSTSGGCCWAGGGGAVHFCGGGDVVWVCVSGGGGGTLWPWPTGTEMGRHAPRRLRHHPFLQDHQ